MSLYIYIVTGRRYPKNAQVYICATPDETKAEMEARNWLLDQIPGLSSACIDRWEAGADTCLEYLHLHLNRWGKVEVQRSLLAAI